jgi:hypothetical protein
MIWGSTNPDFGSSWISVVDLDRDGDLDILYSNGDAFDYAPANSRPWHGVQWLENKGTLQFEFHRIADLPGASSPQAADIDGAKAYQKLIFITIPQLMPIIISISLLDFIWTMQVFPLIWITTGGGPIYSTEVLSTYTYKLAFSSYNLSQASASAVVILLISLGLTLFYIRYQKAR